MSRPGGNPKFKEIRNTDTTASNLKRQALALDFVLTMVPAIQESLREQWGSNYRERADWLNENGYTTRRGGKWSPRQVSRLFKKFIELKKSNIILK